MVEEGALATVSKPGDPAACPATGANRTAPTVRTPKARRTSAPQGPAPEERSFVLKQHRERQRDVDGRPLGRPRVSASDQARHGRRRHLVDTALENHVPGKVGAALAQLRSPATLGQRGLEQRQVHAMRTQLQDVLFTENLASRGEPVRP